MSEKNLPPFPQISTIYHQAFQTTLHTPSFDPFTLQQPYFSPFSHSHKLVPYFFFKQVLSSLTLHCSHSTCVLVEFRPWLIRNLTHFFQNTDNQFLIHFFHISRGCLFLCIVVYGMRQVTLMHFQIHLAFNHTLNILKSLAGHTSPRVQIIRCYSIQHW